MQFLSTPSARRATRITEDNVPAKLFLSTPSARRATRGCAGTGRPSVNFYPRPPRGGRRSKATSRARPSRNFYPRPPRGGRHRLQQRWRPHPEQDFYPRPPRGGRPVCAVLFEGLMDISIHALREEGDGARRHQRGGLHIFLSTPSARRATTSSVSLAAAAFYFYPRPPRGGRPVCAVLFEGLMDISIHALREEGDKEG